ncbi:MAG: hypothetical protein JWR80_9943, partial [Bradyrhizobium sp.]|nr:hypothetical protein [Bradyrhizobium sp.]
MTDPRNASTPAEVGGCRPCVGTLSTAVVEGPLALRMRRFAAASRGEIGLQILTLPHLAARLAGGFVRPAQREELEPAVQKALEAGGFSDLTSLQQLPGMVRALVRTLQRLWLADTVPADYPDTPRLADLHLIDSRVRAALGPAVLVPPDLVAAARTRLDLAANLLGPVTFEPHLWIAPVWRGLIEDIRRRVPVMGLQDQVAASAGVASAQIFICADPHAEVAEALRWARDLVASGRAAPHEIALATAAPRAWDDHMLALSRSAELPVHFSHGVSILTTMDGQACAALAELLAHGLSQERVHRLLAHSAGRCTGLQALPANPLAGLSAEAHLGDLAQWRRALERAQTLRVDGTRPAAVLIPALELLSQGWPAAEEAGALLLPGSSLTVWRAALRSAPPEALAFSLSCLRVADGRDPANSITWCPASHLAGAPRPFVRLIGLTASAWPRAITTDPILPGHVLAIDRDAAPTLPDGDRRAFATIAGGATGELSLSYPRRNGQGGLQAPSPLLRADSPRVSLARLRIPNHAYSEADRLRARLTEAARDPRYALATRCWRARRAPQVTPHDGILQANHPAILRALAQPQSATSLRRLLRDPQGYVWRYALEWRETMPVA